MAQSIDPQFGRAIKAIREKHDWKQSEVADRISTYYRNDGTYRRIENGERLPGRQAAIAILTSGLHLTSIGEIDHLLSLAGYAALANDEISATGLRTNDQEPADAQPADDVQATPAIEPAARNRVQLLASALAVIVAVASGSMLYWIGFDLAAPLVAGAFYAALYGISLFLETAYGDPPAQVLGRSLLAFAVVLFTCDLALLADFVSVQNGSQLGLLWSVTFVACHCAMVRCPLYIAGGARCRYSF